MKPMDTETKIRVEVESRELLTKINNLEKFVFSNKIESLSERSQELLKRQLAAMKIYSGILNERLALDEEESQNG